MNQTGSVITSKTFQKLIFLLFLIVLFDLVYVWDYFSGLDENSDGPEAGLHHLHESRRRAVLSQQVLSGLQLGKPASTSHSHAYLDNLSDGEKIIALEHEVDAWRKKYEDAMVKSGENPYLPFTPVPPNQGNDDGARKPKKSRAELESEETYGADEHIVKILHSANVEIDKE